MELSLELENSREQTQDLVKNQNEFLESTLGKTVNTGIDIGLRYLLPDFIENQVIDIKDTLLNEGLKEGVNKAINTVVDTGKSILGIFTGEFESIGQAYNAIQKGGILDSVSKLFDTVLDNAKKNGTLAKDIVSLLKDGKNTVIKDISKGIDKTFSDQLKSIEKIGLYSGNWQKFYEAKDFDNMEREFTKIKKEMKTILPIEETLKTMREIENIHSLIKNKGGSFDISSLEIEVSKKLA